MATSFRKIIEEKGGCLNESHIRQFLPHCVTESLSRAQEYELAALATELWEGDDREAVLAAYDVMAGYEV